MIDISSSSAGWEKPRMTSWMSVLFGYRVRAAWPNSIMLAHSSRVEVTGPPSSAAMAPNAARRGMSVKSSHSESV
jgi:hypothetical protein